MFLAGAGLVLLIPLLSGNLLDVQAAPAAQLTPFPTPTPGADGRILYIVQEQDTLWRISAITGVPLETLRSLNNLGADSIVVPGDVLLIGLAGPLVTTATPGPSPTPLPAQPTPTQPLGTGNLCVLLFNDLNGDALRQDEEPVIADGAISVSNFAGNVNETETTRVSEDAQCEDIWGDPTGFVKFPDLREGSYNISVAIPEGYNPTTELNASVKLVGGDETYLSFGAQANSETSAEPVIIPEGPERSPLLAIVGGLLLLIGIGVGVYAWLLGRK
jgi:hypothetical protein